MTTRPENPAPDPPPPTACPFCRSANITAAGPKASSAAYWRCVACGELWNVDRLREASRHSYKPRWR